MDKCGNTFVQDLRRMIIEEYNVHIRQRVLGDTYINVITLR